jgi:hypothetical protein
MHSHGNPNQDLGETPRRNAALQIKVGRPDDLIAHRSGGGL